MNDNPISYSTRYEVVDELYRRLGGINGPSRRDLERCVGALQDMIVEALASGGEFRLISFGKFHTQERAARTAGNPQKPGERVTVAARRVAKFTPGTRLRESVKQGRPLPDPNAARWSR